MPRETAYTFVLRKFYTLYLLHPPIIQYVRCTCLKMFYRKEIKYATNFSSARNLCLVQYLDLSKNLWMSFYLHSKCTLCYAIFEKEIFYERAFVMMMTMKRNLCTFRYARVVRRNNCLIFI